MSLLRHSYLLSILLASPAAAQNLDSLLARMTLEEKLGQLNLLSAGGRASPAQMQLARDGKLGGLFNVIGAENTTPVQRIAVTESRLKIPLLFGLDVIHGYRTIFPIPLAEAGSFDPDAAQATARAAGLEAAAAGISWTYAPMVDIARDPRWGRIAEGSGEDPYLGSLMAAAMREIYLPPFKAAVDAGVASLMSAFNDIAGVPSSGNAWLTDTVLRREWGFNGFVVSDWTSVAELINHGVAAGPSEAGRRALTSGVDMDMQSSIYVDSLPALVRANRVPMAVVDSAVMRVLRAKLRLGLFRDPYRARTTPPVAETRALARRVARESIVLLKNEKGLLPLNRNTPTIAVIGPLADSKLDALGPWHTLGQPEDVVTVLQGIRSHASAAQVLYARGAGIEDSSTAGFAEAVAAAKRASVAVLVLGEREDMSGEAASRSMLGLPGVQEHLLEAVAATGTPIVLVLMNGHPLILEWAADHVPAIVETWFLGVEAGNAIADVLFGDANPSGKLPVTIPHSLGQIPLYYNHRNTGRPHEANNKYTSKYLDVPVTPRYPFGFGLTYTTFAFSNLKLSTARARASDTVTATVTVANTGSREGTEVVQLYVRDEVASVGRPVRELKGFQRVTLKPAESRAVDIRVAVRDLAFYGLDMKGVVEPGAFRVYVGPSSAEGQEARFEVIQ